MNRESPSRLRRFWIRLKNWEYWPMELVMVPVFFIYLWFALRARCLTFFTVVNPAIETGGLMGESKINILRRIPAKYLPKTLFLAKGERSLQRVKEWMEAEKLSFPLVCKPNVGLRGFLVKVIQDESGLDHYLTQYPVDILVQEFIEYPQEVGICYHRFPEKANEGHISSVCLKKTLKVRGDGQRTLRQLILDYPRAVLQFDRLQEHWGRQMEEVVPDGEEWELVPLGNHSKGAAFLNGASELDDQLLQVIHQIGQRMDGVYFGRFDIKCKSIGQLKQQKEFKVMEFNGVAGEPAHIYHPGRALWKAYRDYYRHWQTIFDISRQMRQRGLHPTPFGEVMPYFFKLRRHLRAFQSG